MDPDYGKKDEGPGRTLKTVPFPPVWRFGSPFFHLDKRIYSLIHPDKKQGYELSEHST